MLLARSALPVPAYLPGLVARRSAGGLLRPGTIYRKQPDGQWRADAPISASLTASARASTGAAASQTTAPVSVIASGGLGALSASWAKLSGGAITATAPAGFTTAFTATGLAEGESRTATFRATVTDEDPASVIAGEVEVTITRWSAPQITAPPTASAAGPTGVVTTAAITAIRTGGTAPFTVAWVKRSGGAISATAPATLNTAFTATGLTLGETRIAQFDCTVTDANGLEATVTVGVQISRVNQLTIQKIDPVAITEHANNVGSYTTFAAATCTPVGGIAPYTFEWLKWNAGEPVAVSPASQTTRFSSNLPQDANQSNFRCRVTDSLGTQALSEQILSVLIFS